MLEKVRPVFVSSTAVVYATQYLNYPIIAIS